RRDRHVHPAPYGSQLLDRRARLLDVLESARRRVVRPDAVNRGVDVPRAVGIDPDPADGAECVPYGREAVEIGIARLVSLGDLDLDRRTPWKPAQNAGHLVGRD